jgi:nucleoid-associated protein YgaU
MGTAPRADTGLERAKSRGGVRSRPGQGDYIWHEIQQNQTLESISLQYQGDTSLVGQLLELNRDVLADPQLLPIGRAIRVPIR